MTDCLYFLIPCQQSADRSIWRATGLLPMFWNVILAAYITGFLGLLSLCRNAPVAVEPSFDPAVQSGLSNFCCIDDARGRAVSVAVSVQADILDYEEI